MKVHKTLLTIVIVTATGAALAAEAKNEPPPTWPWPGPTPSEIRDALVMKRGIFRPTEQDLKKMEAIAPDKPIAAPAKPRKLLCWGRLWTHLCNPFTEAAVQVLGRKTKAFEVVASDDPQQLLPENLKTFDAIFLNGLHDPTPFLPLNWKTLPPEELAAAKKLDATVKQSILDFVAQDGKGLAGIEGSICALRDWKEFGELMGAFYNGHYVGDFVLKVEEPAHPLTACLGGQPFRVFDQAYVPGPPYSRKNVRVLLSLDMTQTPDPLADPKMAWLKESVKRLEASTGRKNDYPISWVRAHGRGRVFYCSLGVQKAPYANPLFLRYLLAGIQFATGDLPADMTPSEK
jgi:type 1 glutamine amidotransferase